MFESHGTQRWETLYFLKLGGPLVPVLDLGLKDPPLVPDACSWVGNPGQNPLTSLLSPSLRRRAARWIYAPLPSSSLYPIAPVLDPPLGTPLLTIHRQRTPQPSSRHRKTGPSWVCRRGARPPWIRRGCGPPRTPPASSR